MNLSEPFIYTQTRLKQAVELNADPVSIHSLAKKFQIKESALPLLRDGLNRLIEEGQISQVTFNSYRPQRPISDVVVVTIKPQDKGSKSANVELQVEGLPDDFPFKITAKRKLIFKKFGRDLKPHEKMAVVLSRYDGTELRVQKIIGKYYRSVMPSIIGKFKRAAEGGQSSFLSNESGIGTVFKAIAETGDAELKGFTFNASIPANIDPYNPVLIIKDQKWEPETGERIQDIVAKKYGLEPVPPAHVLKKVKSSIAQRLPIEHRDDLTHEKILVIDPSNAHDHDDGILIERTRDGYRTLVVISDVPYYVRPQSTIDKSAKRRGFTHYFKDEAYHMLPAELVSHASLTEEKSASVIYVEQHWDEFGQKVGIPHIGAGIIASQKQFSYGMFDDALKTRREFYSAYDELGSILVANMREERLNFDIDDSNNTPHSFSQMLVSALMIEANSAIAEFLLEGNVPFLTRSHTGNDNVHAYLELKERMDNWGYDLPDDIADVSNQTFIDLIKEAENRKDKERVEREIRTNFIRMAVYSTIPYSHFGLNRENYAHATSPIRRYPDLLALRGVHTALGNDDCGLSEQDTNMMVQTCREMNILQNVTRRVAIDIQKFNAIKGLYGPENRLISATLNSIDPYRAEIVLPKHSGLRQSLDLSKLPEGWSMHPIGNALIYNNSFIIQPGDPLSIRLTNVEPHRGIWEFTDMKPAKSKMKAGMTTTITRPQTLGLA